jgi:hypothetical protein
LSTEYRSSSIFQGQDEFKLIHTANQWIVALFRTISATESTGEGPSLEEDAAISEMCAVWPNVEGPNPDGERPSDGDELPAGYALDLDITPSGVELVDLVPLVPLAPSGITVPTSAISQSPNLGTPTPTDEHHTADTADEGPQGANTAEEGGPAKAGLTGDTSSGLPIQDSQQADNFKGPDQQNGGGRGGRGGKGDAGGRGGGAGRCRGGRAGRGGDRTPKAVAKLGNEREAAQWADISLSPTAGARAGINVPDFEQTSRARSRADRPPTGSPSAKVKLWDTSYEHEYSYGVPGVVLDTPD